MPKEKMPGFNPEQKQIQKEREGFEEEIRAQVKKEKGTIKGIFTSKREVMDKIHEQALEEKEQREIEQVTFDDVLEETDAKGMLSLKTNYEPGLNQLREEGILSEASYSRLLGWEFGGRAVRAHLLRLLSHGKLFVLEGQGGHSKAEHNFGYAFLKYCQEENIIEELKKTIKDIDQKEFIYRIKDVLTIESSNACLWWTHAPYVYERLIERGLKPKQAFTKTLCWAESGYDAIFNGLEEVGLKGLEEFNDYKKKYKAYTYILSANPQGSSHKFAKKMALKVVDKILKESD